MNGFQLYKLNGRELVPCDNVLDWARWFETADRHVAETIVGDARVSTVFLGLDHGFGNCDQPIVFETMVFGGNNDGACQRYSTWAEAEAGHAAIVDQLRSSNGKT